MKSLTTLERGLRAVLFTIYGCGFGILFTMNILPTLYGLPYTISFVLGYVTIMLAGAVVLEVIIDLLTYKKD